MHITIPKRNTSVLGEIKSRRFEIAQTSHMMQVLTSQYSDIIGSIVREYASNIIDAYAKKDPSAPFIKPKIHLPTTIKPYIEFMDFGSGMSYETVWEVFPKMGASTKQNNDDEIGAFGLGAKTAFAYKSAEQWSVESRYDGQKMIFNAHWGEDNWPQFVHIVTVSTTEPNGVTVRIPVAPKDFGAFHSAAAAFLEFFPMEIDITGANAGWKIAKSEYLIEGKEWKIGKMDGEESRVVVGPVIYPITLHNLTGESGYGYYGTNPKLKFIDNLIRHNKVTLLVPIGSVDIVPNREALMFSDRTKGAIMQVFDNIIIDAQTIAEKEISSAKTEWEAISKLYAMWNISAIRDTVKQVRWNGKVLNCADGIPISSADIWAIAPNSILTEVGNFNRSHAIQRRPLDHTVRLLPSRTQLVIYDDTSHGGLGRIENYFREELDKIAKLGGGYYTRRRGSMHTNKEFCGLVIKNKNITPADLKKISKICGGINIDFASSFSAPAKAARTKRNVLLNKYDEKMFRSESTEANKKRKAYYVKTSYSHLIDFETSALKETYDLAKKLKFIDGRTPIYIIPRSLAHLDKTPKWINLWEILKSKIESQLNTVLDKAVLREAWKTQSSGYNDHARSLKLIFNTFTSKEFKDGSLVKEILNDYEGSQDNMEINIISLASLMKIALPDKKLPYSVVDKCKKLLDKFPMLKFASTNAYLHDDDRKCIHTYLNQII